MENQINNRLRLLIKENKTTQKKFCEIIGIKDSALRDILTRNYNPNTDILMKIADKFPQYSINWLLTGVGNMELDYDDVIYNDSKLKNESEPLKEYLPSSNFKLIPLMNLDVAGGSTNHETDTSQYIEKYVPFIDAKDGDICCPVTNNSMLPVYPPGTLVQLRKVERWKEYIDYGQVYVVDLVDGRRLIKQVKRGAQKGEYLLRSFNPEYDDNEVSEEMIYSMWLVVSKFEKVMM
jgi:Predicted transcriptional regulator